MSLLKVVAVGVFFGGLLDAQVVQAWKTFGDRSKLLERQATDLPLAQGTVSSNIAISVDPQTTYQTMDGFGASLTDSSATVIWNAFDPAGRRTLMRELFDAKTGIGLSFVRQPMGASDFSASGNYSYDDVVAGQTDPALNNFTIAHDMAAAIPLLKIALGANPALHVLSEPWSPPAWMKTNLSMNAGALNQSYASSFAQYFVKYVQAYQAQGIPIYAVAVQNEPENPSSASGNVNYPSMHMDATDEAAFIGNSLGPALVSAGLSKVKILAFEHNWDIASYAQAVLSNATAAKYIAGSAFHCYGGNEAAQSTVKAAYPGKDIWFTECSGTAGSNFAGDLAWNAEHLLIGATRNWARSVVLWNIALDQNSGPHNGGCTNCRGLLTIDASKTPAQITRNVEYYVLGHLAKFVQPGALRIDSSDSTGGLLKHVAFRNPDGTLVLLVLNTAQSTSSFAVNAAGRSFSDALPAGAVATYVWSTRAPAFPGNGVVNAASAGAALSPGALFSIYGSDLAGMTQQAESLPLTNSFGSTSVEVNGLAAPLIYAGPGQINAQIPWEVMPGAATVAVMTGGQTQTQTVNIAPSGVGLFTADGMQASALNPDGSVNGMDNPAPSGQYVSLFGTGQGTVTASVVTGEAATADPIAYTNANLTATTNLGPVAAFFAGLAPSLVGVLQVNTYVPSVAAKQPVALHVTLGGTDSNTVQIWVAP